MRDQRDRHRDSDRGVQADPRIDSRNHRKADRLGDQGERDDDAGQDVA